MSDDLVWLDGNAAAGTLARLFTVDATWVMVTCDTCNTEARLGQLRLYGGSMGIVLRCANCDAVVLRAVETGNMLRVDARGAARLDVDPLETAGDS